MRQSRKLNYFCNKELDLGNQLLYYLLDSYEKFRFS